MIYLIQFIFYGIPIAALWFFFSSLYRYLSAKRKNKTEPDSFSVEEMKKRKLLLIVSSVIAGVLVAVVVAFAILLFSAVAFM